MTCPSSRTEMPFQMPRRRDRAVQDTAWIRDLLHRAPVGALALSGDKAPFLVPNLFVFDGERDAIYLHAARAGQCGRQSREKPAAAFCVAEMGRLLPAEAAINFSVEYASVVVEGTSSLVEDPQEATYALKLLMTKYAPQYEYGKDYRGVDAKDLAKTAVFRVDITSWSAKGKTSDLEDAYPYPAASACPHLQAEGQGGIRLPSSESRD